MLTRRLISNSSISFTIRMLNTRSRIVGRFGSTKARSPSRGRITSSLSPPSTMLRTFGREWSFNTHRILLFLKCCILRVYNHLQLVSKINVGCDYMFFKKGVPPMWEDPQNSDGGIWKLNLDKKYHNTCLDTYWLNIVGVFMLSVGVWVIFVNRLILVSCWR